MENLREVNFFLSKDPGYGVFDFENDKENEALVEETKKRQGLFHCWGNEIVTVESERLTNTYAIVEELETGTVYQVLPENIQFIVS